MIEIPQELKVLERIAYIASEPDAEKPYTPKDVSAILAAYAHVLDGDPVGSILKRPTDGAIAVRANVDGLHMWRISAPDGSQWNDLQPTLEGWVKVE
jgi:hypothetical protein